MNISATASLMKSALPWALGRARTEAPKPADVGPTDEVSLSGAKATASTKDVTVVGRFPSKKWAWIEHLHDNDPHFKQQNFHPRGVQRDSEIVKAFGTDKPHSGSVLLHYAGDPPPGVPRKEPVILVHGANKTGDFYFDPSEDGKNQGLAQRLRDEGHPTYAVTFAHNQDDNYYWAESLANSIDRVKTLTGAEKVDLVGHSKGGLPVRMYTSDFRQDWMTPYRNDVNRVVLVAAPNGGIDYSFRHPAGNYALASSSNNPHLNAPVSWDNMLYWGMNKDVRDQGFSKDGPDLYPGQRQLLARWDSKYPLSIWEVDSVSTYEGGQGMAGRGRGIEHFIKEGGDFIANLGKKSFAQGVEVAVLAGNSADIPGILNEYTGPSDGLLLVDSALKLPKGTRVVAEDILPLHHKALISNKKGQDWIAAALSPEKKPIKKRVSIPKTDVQAAAAARLPQIKELTQPLWSSGGSNPSVLNEL